jgi:FkbM family methyltransferase
MILSKGVSVDVDTDGAMHVSTDVVSKEATTGIAEQLSHHKAIGKEYLAKRYFKDYSEDDFREIDFRSRKFYIRSKANDIVKWIVSKREGEGKVAEEFEKILRIGNSTDPNIEKGYCTKGHRDAEATATAGSRKHSIFLDIGANAGFYGLYASAVGCRTYFFDIQEECHDWISSAIDKNKFHHAALIPYPIGNVTQTLHIKERSNGCHGTFSFSSTGAEWYLDKMKIPEPLDVKMIRIDDILMHAMKENTLQPIACIKVDVEGYEIGIIASMRNLVRHKQKTDGTHTVKNLVIELSPPRWSGLPNGGITRQVAADIICDVLWDAGFDKVIAWGNYDWDDTKFSNREGFHKFIVEGKFLGISQDFSFKRSNDEYNGY